MGNERDAERREALRLLGAIAAGADPAAARKAEARTMTLAALCDLYLAEGTRRSPSRGLQGCAEAQAAGKAIRISGGQVA
jgi:hypothetical protein